MLLFLLATLQLGGVLFFFCWVLSMGPPEMLVPGIIIFGGVIAYVLWGAEIASRETTNLRRRLRESVRVYCANRGIAASETVQNDVAERALRRIQSSPILKSGLE